MQDGKSQQGLSLDDIRLASTLFKESLEKAKGEANKPLTVAIMGQTGVGKSSLINKLFNTNLPTSDDLPCTKEITPVHIGGVFKDRLLFYDLPGIGEAEEPDARYLEQYRHMLLSADVVLWAIHADNRSITFDLQALDKILAPFDDQQKGALMSKITLVLTKADLIAPEPWILLKLEQQAMFGVQPKTQDLLTRKAQYYQQHFIRPFGHLLTSETHNDSNFIVDTGPFSSSQYIVRYRGFMDQRRLAELKQLYPRHSALLERLYANYQVITCSAHYRYNLTQLMLVIINKLGRDAIARFSDFVRQGSLNRMPFEQARQYYNFIVVDQQGRKLFDLQNQRF